jgi:Tfp pilus assembly protein PilP
MAQNQSVPAPIEFQTQVSSDQPSTPPPPPPPNFSDQAVPPAPGQTNTPPIQPQADSFSAQSPVLNQPYQVQAPPVPGQPYNQTPNLATNSAPPEVPSIPPREPDPEPTTPEEAAALEVKQQTFAELDKWHSTIMTDYVFNTSMMFDPFLPIESVARPPEKQLNQVDEERRRRLPLLQRLALNQFTLSAIVVASNPNATSALLDSGGRSFIVHRGTLIGPNGGYVKEISSNRVIIEEPLLDYRGETRPVETVFRLNALEDDSLDEFKIEQGYGG